MFTPLGTWEQLGTFRVSDCKIMEKAVPNLGKKVGNRVGNNCCKPLNSSEKNCSHPSQKGGNGEEQ
jgi:hypothetical protein